MRPGSTSASRVLKEGVSDSGQVAGEVLTAEVVVDSNERY